MRKPIRLCRCGHPYRQHDCLTSSPVQWRCNGVDCKCRKFEDQLEGATEASGQLASLFCRLGMWCAQQRNRNFNASTDEVEQYILAVGRQGVPIREALEAFLVTKLYDTGSDAVKVAELVKARRADFKKEVDFFVEKYRVLIAEHVLVS